MAEDMRLVKMPRLGQDMEEGVIVQWLKSVGDEVGEGEILAVIETDKAEVAFEVPSGGYLVAVLMAPGSTVATGEPIAWIADDPSAQPPSVESQLVPSPTDPAPSGNATPRQQAPPPPPPRSRRKPVSPLARRKAGELGVDLEDVEGTGPGGRVTADDVLLAHRSAQAQVDNQVSCPACVWRSPPACQSRPWCPSFNSCGKLSWRGLKTPAMVRRSLTRISSCGRPPKPWTGPRRSIPVGSKETRPESEAIPPLISGSPWRSMKG